MTIHAWWLVVYKAKEQYIVVRSISGSSPIIRNGFPGHDLLCRVYGRDLRLVTDVMFSGGGLVWDTNRKYPNQFKFFCGTNPMEVMPDKYGLHYTKLIDIDYENKEILYKLI